MTRQPRAFRLDDPDVVTVRADEPAPERRGAVVVTEEPMEAIEAADGALVPLAPRRSGAGSSARTVTTSGSSSRKARG